MSKNTKNKGVWALTWALLQNFKHGETLFAACPIENSQLASFPQKALGYSFGHSFLDLRLEIPREKGI